LGVVEVEVIREVQGVITGLLGAEIQDQEVEIVIAEQTPQEERVRLYQAVVQLVAEEMALEAQIQWEEAEDLPMVTEGVVVNVEALQTQIVQIGMDQIRLLDLVMIGVQVGCSNLDQLDQIDREKIEDKIFL
jgi:hypothetical protein